MRNHQTIRSFNRTSAWGFITPAPFVIFYAISVAFFCADLVESQSQSKSDKSKCAPVNSVSRCTPGLSIECPCDAIRRGYQVCNSDGTWDPCNCSVCGDGRIDEGEECDPGKYGFNDYYGGCKQDCTLAAHCGDGVLDKYNNEECEIGNAGITAEECRNCTLVRCGDGYVDSGEECDNGDYGNHGYYGGCTQDCRFAARCGDGFVEVMYEECDDGLNNSDVLPGACRTDCKKARCGDGVVDDGETCDMGNRTMACKAGELDCTVCGASCQNVPGVIFQALPFPVTDAEYSRALNRVVAINNATSTLAIYDPFGNNITNVELDNLPTSVSVGPTGEQAAVGHEFSVTLVDLVQGTIVSHWYTSGFISDVVLGNGFIYTFSEHDDAIISLEIATSMETRSTGNTIGPITKAKLHPDGTKIYGVGTNDYRPSLERYDIKNGTAENAYSSHEGYDSCKDLWISQDGSRIFTACGNVFTSSDTRGPDPHSDPYPRTSTQDMQYIETLPVSRIVHLDHHQRGEGVAVAIESFVDPYYTPDPSISQRLHFFSNGQSGYDANKSTYSLDKVIGIPNYRTEWSEFGANGKFVFFSSNGLDLITVVQVESGAGLYHDFVLVLPAEI